MEYTIKRSFDPTKLNELSLEYIKEERIKKKITHTGELFEYIYNKANGNIRELTNDEADVLIEQFSSPDGYLHIQNRYLSPKYKKLISKLLRIEKEAQEGGQSLKYQELLVSKIISTSPLINERGFIFKEYRNTSLTDDVYENKQSGVFHSMKSVIKFLRTSVSKKSFKKVTEFLLDNDIIRPSKLNAPNIEPQFFLNPILANKSLAINNITYMTWNDILEKPLINSIKNNLKFKGVEEIDIDDAVEFILRLHTSQNRVAPIQLGIRY